MTSFAITNSSCPFKTQPKTSSSSSSTITYLTPSNDFTYKIIKSTQKLITTGSAKNLHCNKSSMKSQMPIKTKQKIR